MSIVNIAPADTFAFTGVVVGQATVWTFLTCKFERTLAIARVLVPVPVRPEYAAVFCKLAGLNDAFAALLIEHGTCRTGCCLLDALTRAGRGIPLGIHFAVDALAAFLVELTSWAREWKQIDHEGVRKYALAR